MPKSRVEGREVWVEIETVGLGKTEGGREKLADGMEKGGVVLNGYNGVPLPETELTSAIFRKQKICERK